MVDGSSSIDGFGSFESGSQPFITVAKTLVYKNKRAIQLPAPLQLAGHATPRSFYSDLKRARSRPTKRVAITGPS